MYHSNPKTEGAEASAAVSEAIVLMSVGSIAVAIKEESIMFFYLSIISFFQK